jgi:hypothetical protein
VARPEQTARLEARKTAQLLLVLQYSLMTNFAYETRTRAEPTVWGWVHVEGFCRCFFQSADAPPKASEVRAWKPVPLRSKGLGLRFPPDKIGFQTYMRAFKFVEDQLNRYRTKRSSADGACRVVCPVDIVVSNESAGMRSGQGMASL